MLSYLKADATCGTFMYSSLVLNIGINAYNYIHVHEQVVIGFWFCFSLVEKAAQVHITNQSQSAQ